MPILPYIEIVFFKIICERHYLEFLEDKLASRLKPLERFTF